MRAMTNTASSNVDACSSLRLNAEPYQALLRIEIERRALALVATQAWTWGPRESAAAAARLRRRRAVAAAQVSVTVLTPCWACGRHVGLKEMLCDDPCSVPLLDSRPLRTTQHLHTPPPGQDRIAVLPSVRRAAAQALLIRVHAHPTRIVYVRFRCCVVSSAVASRRGGRLHPRLLHTLPARPSRLSAVSTPSTDTQWDTHASSLTRQHRDTGASHEWLRAG
jgi:hypothetical protein